MASAIIHLAVAKELENRMKKVKNTYDYYLGSIAPDLAKQIGIPRVDSHFEKNMLVSDIPNLKLFETKYPNYKENDYDLGYYVHLYTDKEWTLEFMNKIVFDNYSSIHLLDGSTILFSPEEVKSLLYSDYTNINIKIIEEFDLDLSLFYEEFKVPKTEITEIPADKLDILINKMGIIIQNSKGEKTYSLDPQKIIEFIKNTADKLEKELDVI